TPEIVREWGQVLGRIHTLSGTFEPSSESRRRQHWFEDDDFNAEKYLPPDQTLVIERCRKMIERAHSLKTDAESFGLIHGDLHAYNFLVTDDGITVLDFEGSRYDWFVNDLAIPVFYAVRDPAINRNDNEFVNWFMRNLVEGYSRENTLDKDWFAEIGFFHKLREVMLYILLHAEGLEDLDPWSEAFMKGRRESIEQQIPIIEADFTRL
ncbi:phosphotransferase, partial [candidate division WOR-3 bacterium]|nr:phosphotransferase [candidate division WOR-3 bacterium]MBD3364246.1 phosphotransferase [candidate division WOR-3 bacterium]